MKVTFFYADLLVYEVVDDIAFADESMKSGNGVGGISYSLCFYYEWDSFVLSSLASSIFAFRNGIFLNWL